MIIQSLEDAGLSVRDFEDFLGKVGDLLPVPLRQRMDLHAYSKKLTSRAEVYLALDDLHTPIALAAFYANDMKTLEAHMPVIGVLPSFQGKGVGKVLMQRAFAVSRQKGMRCMTLEVHRTNTGAQRLYQKLGFCFTNQEGDSWQMRLVFSGVETVGSGDSITLLQRNDTLKTAFDLPIDLRIKRDDLYSMPGGGNKARKIHSILRHAMSQGYTALVTNGGKQSNHARATAIVAAQYGLHCHLVIHGKSNESYLDTGNILLMRMAGAHLDYCEHSDLAARMDAAMENLSAQGHKPLYIWGGGHCVYGTIPFVDAVEEFRGQAGSWEPDVMVFASATGTTHAGFAVGFSDSETRVIGISAARDSKRGEGIVKECIGEYFDFRSQPQREVKVEFRDEWTCGGYELHTPKLREIISRAACCGLFVDPTYSGKAFMGLVDLVRGGEILPESKVLFWHTGGLMNLIASQAFSHGLTNFTIGSQS